MGTHASRLAEAIWDWSGAPFSNESGYSVSCKVDIGPSMGLRVLNISRALDGGGSTFTIESTGQECSPLLLDAPRLTVASLVSDPMLATGAAASWKLLSENSYRDGWWNTLWHTTQWIDHGTDHDKSWLNFNNSGNPLEDALGLASGVGLGNFWGGACSEPDTEYEFTLLDQSIHHDHRKQCFCTRTSNRTREGVGIGLYPTSSLRGGFAAMVGFWAI